jgi:hypothetical protein
VGSVRTSSHWADSCRRSRVQGITHTHIPDPHRSSTTISTLLHYLSAAPVSDITSKFCIIAKFVNSVSHIVRRNVCGLRHTKLHKPSPSISLVTTNKLTKEMLPYQNVHILHDLSLHIVSWPESEWESGWSQIRAPDDGRTLIHMALNISDGITFE